MEPLIMTSLLKELVSVFIRTMRHSGMSITRKSILLGINPIHLKKVSMSMDSPQPITLQIMFTI